MNYPQADSIDFSFYRIHHVWFVQIFMGLSNDSARQWRKFIGPFFFAICDTMSFTNNNFMWYSDINIFLCVTRTCVTSTLSMLKSDYLFSCPKTPRKHVNVVITIFDGESKCCFNEGLLKLKDFFCVVIFVSFYYICSALPNEKYTPNHHHRYHFPIPLTHNIRIIFNVCGLMILLKEWRKRKFYFSVES